MLVMLNSTKLNPYKYILCTNSAHISLKLFINILWSHVRFWTLNLLKF